MADKERLDVLLLSRGLVSSRERAKGLIMAGRVLVDGRVLDKAGTAVDPSAEIHLKEDDIPFVGRGGVKLEGAIQALELSVAGLVFLDIGASTGGFTDCLLKRGARKVFAVDVGYGQLDWRLRNDPRVINLERINARYLDPQIFGEKVDGVVIDVSFISLLLILPPLRVHLKDGGWVLAMVKPQFEAGPGEVGKTGVIKDPTVRDAAIDKVRQGSLALGFTLRGEAPSPLPGTKGNREHFLLLSWGGAKCQPETTETPRGSASC